MAAFAKNYELAVLMGAVALGIFAAPQLELGGDCARIFRLCSWLLCVVQGRAVE
jgi:hypothetical protein